MSAKDEGRDVLCRHLEFLGNEMAEPRAIEHARHADDHVVGQAGEFAQGPHHRVERIGDADDERARGVGLDAFADRLHDFQVDAEQIVTAHPRLARHAGGNDDHVRARDVLVIIGARDLRVEPFNRAALTQVERFSLRNALHDVEQDNVTQFLLRGEMGKRPTNITCANQRDLLASHGDAILPFRWGNWTRP